MADCMSSPTPVPWRAEMKCSGANGTGPAATVTLSVQSAAGHHGGGQLDALTLALLLTASWLAARRRSARFRPFAPGRAQKNA